MPTIVAVILVTVNNMRLQISPKRCKQTYVCTFRFNTVDDPLYPDGLRNDLAE
jgi:hypothetical protein